MLASGGRNPPRGTMPRTSMGPRTPVAPANRPPAALRAPLARPEPDYEVVEFPSEQYVNTKLHPPPPPPRLPAMASEALVMACGLCGGGGARVRCAECGRRALCASCDEMYHRHPKRRHHLRQTITASQPMQLRDVRPPLPPKVTAPVPPPRRHKLSADRMSASPRPFMGSEQQRPGVGSVTMAPTSPPFKTTMTQQMHQTALMHDMPRIRSSVRQSPTIPYPKSPTQPATVQFPQPVGQANTLSHPSVHWNRTRTSLPNSQTPAHPNTVWPAETWEAEGVCTVGVPSWNRPLRRGASVLELGAGSGCGGACAHCSPFAWRYGSCANLEHSQHGVPWINAWPPVCCAGPHEPPGSTHSLHHHQHGPITPQHYRKGESRVVSRVGSRAASPAISVRSRGSRRAKLRSPSPPLPSSSDADSEDESEGGRGDMKSDRIEVPPRPTLPVKQSTALTESWQCEHCTFMNEGAGRICAVCCRTSVAPSQGVDTSISETTNRMQNLRINDKPTSVRKVATPPVKQNNEDTNNKHRKERVSTGCGPSPPRETPANRTLTSRQGTPVQNKSNGHREYNTDERKNNSRHDVSVGPSPPREGYSQESAIHISPPREAVLLHHSVSVGPSSPRDNTNTLRERSPLTQKTITSVLRHNASVGPSPPRESSISKEKTINGSFSDEQCPISIISPPSVVVRNTSTTGTSPPPQSISTQTYEVPQPRETSLSANRSRSRRRPRDEARRERSHSRVSLSSDTRESERSGRTSGGRWEWREPRDSSPGGGDWSESERRRAGSRLTRRASHLDLRRSRPPRRSSLYGSEAASPEPMTTGRAISLEALAGAGARREAERGLELARLLGEAERAGFSAAEMHAALAQSPSAPLTWLRERWPGLCAGVRAAAARLVPGTNVSESEARNALARHRGALWPAVTECVERHRRAAEDIGLGEERRMRGHVWGSPAGADDEGAPPPRVKHRHRNRDDESSDEREEPPSKKVQDNWVNSEFFNDYVFSTDVPSYQNSTSRTEELNFAGADTGDIARNLNSFLIQAGINTVDENLLLKGLLNTDNNIFSNLNKASTTNKTENSIILEHAMDLHQSENDFIDAYNALTRLSPLPNIQTKAQPVPMARLISPKEQVALKNNDMEEVTAFTSKARNSTNIQQTNKICSSNSINSFKSPKSNSQTHHTKPVDKNNKQISDTKIINEIGSAKINYNENKKEINQPEKTYVTINNEEKEHNDKIDLDNVEDNRPEKDKTSNLTDIVDNTQKLIQQMKEEINSDMNSFDGEKSFESESESNSDGPDHSSESNISYSDSNENSNDVTSNGKETSSESENNSQIRSERRSISNRTSSEENEQFEEAIDHLEPMDEYTQTNIDVLNSIVRNLQEHTISVKINEPLSESKQKMKTKSNQDVNNNYAPVKTFEEIYEDLRVDESEISISKPAKSITERSNNNKSVNSTLEQNMPSLDSAKQQKVIDLSFLDQKRDVEIILFKPDFAKRILVSDNKTPIHNALLEEQEVYPEEEDNSIKSNTQHNIDEHVHLETKLSANNENQAELAVNNTSINIEINNNHDSSQTFRNSNDSNLSNTTANYFSFDSLVTLASDEIPIFVNSILNQNTANSSHDETEKVKNDTTELRKSPSLSNPIKTVSVTETTEINETLEKIISSDEKSSFEHAENNDNITIDTKDIVVTVKSNIPKPIKSLTRVKQKLEKPFSKITSKVPIRKMSTKQHPAPVPPKTHFGNIQSGHVKQLQSRLFNKNEDIQDASVFTDNATTSTGTTTKSIKTLNIVSKSNKKRAPAPPQTAQSQKQKSPPKSTTAKPYFRETCHTEDDWSESEEEHEISVSGQTRVTSDEPPPTPPSPPLPPTIRRVSGNIVDLTLVRLPEGSPERQARMLLAEGATETWEQAQLAVDLVERGVEAPVALLAALECADLSAALAYVNQECELCASRLPEHEMVSMLCCTHRCCRECARHYFTVQITERSIVDCVCPYCKLPELEGTGDDAELEYFAHLDIVLKTMLPLDVHELFQRKLRDRTLARDPNFRWCVECSSGFFVHPKQKRLRCPECRSVTCASCRKPWLTQHENLSCEQFAEWLEDNDPERSVAAVQQHLRENGLECPRCHFKYSLSRGGCMHFTCTQCKYEFCYGCGKPFTMGTRCGLSEYCAKLGLHAHHPRNCLFYLRDKEPRDLQTLLQMNNVAYETEAPEGSPTNGGRCPIQLQRETPAGLVDSTCGGEVAPKNAGYCKVHYLEYLAGLARGLDPIPIMDLSELVAELRRRALPLPERGPWDSDPIYAGMCAEIVKEKIPLD